MRAYTPVLVGAFLLAGALRGRAADKEPVYEGKTVREWVRTLRAEDPATRRAAAAPEASGRRLAARALSALGGDAGPASAALLAALHDESFNVRRVAAAALLRVGPEPKVALGPLLDALGKEKDPDVAAALAA